LALRLLLDPALVIRLLHCIFEAGTRPEPDGSAGRNLQRFTGLGIPTTSRWTVANLNRDEPGQSYALTSAYSRGD
jgi:hypothetical protein